MLGTPFQVSRSYVFPLRRDPKLRQAGSTPNIATASPPEFGVRFACDRFG